MRKKKNMITQLENDEGDWVLWDDGLQQVIQGYFNKLFSSEGWDSRPILQTVRHRVTKAHNLELLRPFEANEVREAIFDMHSNKSPGPDGMNPGFFQEYWDIVGENVGNC